MWLDPHSVWPYRSQAKPFPASPLFLPPHKDHHISLRSPRAFQGSMAEQRVHGSRGASHRASNRHSPRASGISPPRRPGELHRAPPPTDVPASTTGAIVAADAEHAAAGVGEHGAHSKVAERPPSARNMEDAMLFRQPTAYHNPDGELARLRKENEERMRRIEKRPRGQGARGARGGGARAARAEGGGGTMARALWPSATSSADLRPSPCEPIERHERCTAAAVPAAAAAAFGTVRR